MLNVHFGINGYPVFIQCILEDWIARDTDRLYQESIIAVIHQLLRSQTRIFLSSIRIC